jgi:hypothetical protein
MDPATLVIIRTLICLLFLSVPVHAETKRFWPPHALRDPATLVVTIMSSWSGQSFTFEREFPDLSACHKKANEWQNDPKTRPQIIHMQCKKWIKMAPADG